MKEVTDTKIYAYSTEVTVEIMGVDSHGDFAIVSYQFSFDNDQTTLRVKGDIDPQHESYVESALEEAGYTLV
ncbi:hypothetical protein [Haloplanus pelagicus]|uniref:hypothetical protein n=1 Tax=Haloplanus pelagicus TaxID=2949995 RepID=UPI00203F6668|nr:hypothetical protein [Haloplanus sp. HW8-1]